jgi:hypothetical protein
MTKEDVKRFWEDHKVAIKTGVKIGVGIAAAVVIGKKLKSHCSESDVLKPELIECAKCATKPKVEFTPPSVPKSLIEFGVPAWDGCYSKYLEFMLPTAQPDGTGYSTKVSDLPRLIDAIHDIPGVTDESSVWALFNIEWN